MLFCLKGKRLASWWNRTRSREEWQHNHRHPSLSLSIDRVPLKRDRISLIGVSCRCLMRRQRENRRDTVWHSILRVFQISNAMLQQRDWIFMKWCEGQKIKTYLYKTFLIIQILIINNYKNLWEYNKISI